MILDQISIHSWIQNNAIKTETGESLDFYKYRFMFDIYADRSDLICCMKCAQIGFTTYEILKTAHECKNEGIDILYVLPTADDVKRFSGGKTNKIIAQNPILESWTKDKDSIEQKQFGKNTVYYQGSWTERAALMITAKKLVVDEYDRCKQDIIQQYDSRLQSIANPKKAFFSNPSFPDFGVDKFYKQSDQKKWHITHSCGERYIMDEDCIDYTVEKFICPFCKQEITDKERTMGEWIATSSGEWSGYWIPLWIAPWMSAKNIAKMKRDKSKEYFANFVAGLPYVGSDDVVSSDIINRNLTDRLNRQEGTIVIGVDTGLPIHYVIGNKDGIFYHGTCERYDVLEGFLKRWSDAIIVSDQGGDLIGIRELQEKYPSRVYLCWFSKETKTQQLIRWGDEEESYKVLADRNRMIQLVIDEFKNKLIPIYGGSDEWRDYITHWRNIYRVKDIKDENEPSYGWRYIWKRKGPDHFAISTIYWRIGIDRFSENMAVIVGEDAFFGIQQGRIF